MTRWEGGRALILTHADSCTARANTTVRLSTDNGQSFPFSELLDPVSGYSTAAMVGADLSKTDLIGVLYEQFASAGKTNCSILFATANASQILASGGSPPPPPVPPLGRRQVVVPGIQPLHLKLGPPRQLRNSSSGAATLSSRPSVQQLILGNRSLVVVSNGTFAPGGCLWISQDPHVPRAEWTKVFIGAHHDAWLNTTTIAHASESPWQFEGPMPSCEALHEMHGWNLAACEARRSVGMCTSAILDTCGNHESCRPELCRSSGGQVLTATSDSSVIVCYDMLGCLGRGNWSSIWCVDVFGIR